MGAYRVYDCEGLLHNALVELMNTLDITVEILTVGE